MLTPHIIDMTVPDSEWEGYWCDIDKRFHKDGTEQFHNKYCITCKHVLTLTFPDKTQPALPF